MSEDLKSWEEFRVIAALSACWWCGLRTRPAGWYGPWLIERAHIVNSPRRRDRRVAVLLCSRCHKVQHGERFIESLMVARPTLSQMLRLKKMHDPEHYDRAYLQANHLGMLPKAARKA